DILDLATGTGDLAIQLCRIGQVNVTGIDISGKMLDVAGKKIKKKGLGGKISLLQADAEKIPFPDCSYDIVSIAFGIRNVENINNAIAESFRVLRRNGKFMVLEFSKPTGFPVKQLYFFYFRIILPFFGRLFTKDKNAYRYLPESVLNFPDGQDFIDILLPAGFVHPMQKRLTGGVATLYIVEKQAEI
ncbi:MAG: ubiquinone/menaquinone biosynthesis methyltransferase, partial [Bacteroidetes bacterium]|nr:ubiquinone/menaquinone biosynthesis methyltransferase [Bacteroidota bacterium]